MTLEQRVADRLDLTLDRLTASGSMLPAAERGMCVDDPDSPTVVVTVEHAARIVALTIRADEPADHQDAAR